MCPCPNLETPRLVLEIPNPPKGPPAVFSCVCTQPLVLAKGETTGMWKNSRCPISPFWPPFGDRGPRFRANLRGNSPQCVLVPFEPGPCKAFPRGNFPVKGKMCPLAKEPFPKALFVFSGKVPGFPGEKKSYPGNRVETSCCSLFPARKVSFKKRFGEGQSVSRTSFFVFSPFEGTKDPPARGAASLVLRHGERVSANVRSISLSSVAAPNILPMGVMNSFVCTTGRGSSFILRLYHYSCN